MKALLVSTQETNFCSTRFLGRKMLKELMRNEEGICKDILMWDYPSTVDVWFDLFLKQGEK